MTDPTVDETADDLDGDELDPADYVDEPDSGGPAGGQAIDDDEDLAEDELDSDDEADDDEADDEDEDDEDADDTDDDDDEDDA